MGEGGGDGRLSLFPTERTEQGCHRTASKQSSSGPKGQPPLSLLEVYLHTIKLREQLRITEPALEAIFRACGAKDSQSGKGGGGLPTALSILRDANMKDLLTTQTREAAVIFIIKWCKEDSSSFAKIMAELEESDKTPQVRDNLAYANALYSGYSDGYSA